jgi:hypothetical protein
MMLFCRDEGVEVGPEQTRRWDPLLLLGSQRLQLPRPRWLRDAHRLY